MKVIILFFVAVFAFIRAEIAVEDGVLVLNDENFEAAITAHTKILVEFYAPWCGHCKNLAPEWIKAAKSLSNSPIKLAKVDATENTKLAETFKIKGFPTIKYFANGKPSDYNGGRTEGEIVAWANKKAGPAVVTIISDEELLKYQETHEVFTLGVFDSIDSETAKKFIQTAEADELHQYVITAAASIKSTLGLSKDTVLVLKSFDDLRSDLDVSTKYDSEEVAQFILGNSIPLVQEFSQENSKKIFSNPITKHTLIFTDKKAAHHEEVLKEYRTVAADFKGRLLFINVPSSETKVLEYFGLTSSDLPTMVTADMNGESGIKKYPYKGEIKVPAIKEFLNNVLDGKLKPSLKSEEVLPSDTTGDVVILRGESFADLVLHNNKDVLVEFYAPWCGHCKKLAPTWDELGSTLKSNENIVVAKMDATANEIDVAGVNVRGFPTIYFFKGDDKANPVRYEEGRELNDFLKYLEKNAHHKITHDEL